MSTSLFFKTSLWNESKRGQTIRLISSMSLIWGSFKIRLSVLSTSTPFRKSWGRDKTWTLASWISKKLWPIFWMEKSSLISLIRSARKTTPGLMVPIFSRRIGSHTWTAFTRSTQKLSLNFSSQTSSYSTSFRIIIPSPRWWKGFLMSFLWKILGSTSSSRNFYPRI